MHLVSFNINSIRARIPQLEAIVEQYQPAVIGLQETKVQDVEFPIEKRTLWCGIDDKSTHT